MSSFANGTSVSVEKTRGEIEKMLMKVGASSFGTITDMEHSRAMIGFTYKGLQIQMSVPIPSAKQIPHEGKREAETRRRWRCVALALKAKLISCEDGVTTFEKEFLPYMVMPDGSTLGERFAPAIEAAKTGGFTRTTLALVGATA